MDLTARTRTSPTLTAYHKNSEPPVTKGAEIPKARSWPLNKREARSGYKHVGPESLVATGDPTQTHEQHITQGQEDLPVYPKSLKHVRSSVHSNQMLGGASLGRFPRPHKDDMCKRNSTQAPILSQLCLFHLSQ